MPVRSGHYCRMAIFSRVRGWFAHVFWHVVGWMVVVPCALVLVCRFTGWMPKTLIVGLVSVTLLVVLPAYLALGLAALGKHRILTAVATIVCVVHACLFVSRLGLGNAPVHTPGKATIRIFEANVLFLNPDLNRIGQEISAAAPDVVVIEELTPAGLTQLRSSGAFSAFPYSVERTAQGASGTGIFAKWPLVDRRDPLYYKAALLGVTLKHPTGDIDVYSVHTQAPTSSRQAWTIQLKDLKRLFATFNSRPTIMAGDYNATVDHRAFRELLESGVTDAHEATGRELAGSWPNDTSLWPVILIDHVLVKGGIKPLRTFEGQGVGSDHRPVIADLELPG